MKKFLNKTAAMDFRKPAKRLLILALIVVLVGGALSAWMLRTQLSGLAALDRAEEHSVRETEDVPRESEHGDAVKIGRYEHAHDREDAEIDPFEAGLVARPTTAAMAVCIAWLALCGLCALAYWLMVAAWLYKAAVHAGMNRALWPILGLAGNLLAVAAFLIVRGRLSRCARCGAWQKPSVYCRSCGSPMQRKCPGCDTPCGADDAHCPKCGAALDADADADGDAPADADADGENQ